MAKTTIGKLSAILSLNTAQFSKGMRSVGKRFKTFRKSVNAAGVRVAKFGAALGAAAVAGMGLLVRNSMQTLDRVGKLSDAIGVTTEKLLAYQHASRITGADTEQLNKGLLFFSKAIGEVSTGISTEATKAVQLLGLDAKKLSKLPLAESFEEVVDRLGKLEDTYKFAAVSQRLFGRGGKELMNFFQVGKTGIADFENELRRLGGTLDRDSIAKVEAANDAMTRFKTAVGGVANQVAVALAPSLEILSDKFTDTVAGVENMSEKITARMKDIARSVAAVIVLADRLFKGYGVLFATGRLLTGPIGGEHVVSSVTGAPYRPEGGIEHFMKTIDRAMAQPPTVQSLLSDFEFMDNGSAGDRQGVANSHADQIGSSTSRVVTN